MPPKGHRRSARERIRAEVAAVKTTSRPKSRLTARTCGNPIVDVLTNPTPGRVAALLASADEGRLTTAQVRGALTAELGAVAAAMLSREGLGPQQRMGFSIRREILQQLLNSLEEHGTASAAVTCVVIFPQRLYGPAHGDQVKTGKGAA